MVRLIQRSLLTGFAVIVLVGLSRSINAEARSTSSLLSTHQQTSYPSSIQPNRSGELLLADNNKNDSGHDRGETEKCKGNSGKDSDEGCPPKKCGDDDKGQGKNKCKKHESGDDDDGHGGGGDD